MSDLCVLLVEDDKSQQALYADAFEEFTKKMGVGFSLEVSETSADAIDKLKRQNFDAVFLDLLLSGDTANGAASGNDVLSYILEVRGVRLVVYVVSGTLHSLDEKFSDVFENPLMRKFDRSENTGVVINDLVGVLNTGVTRILGRSGRLEKLINEIFFKHLASSFDVWLSRDSDSEKELLRYTALHLLEYLDLPDQDSGGESGYFNPEFYIYPPIKMPAATGDIVEFEGDKYVVLSPSCDLVPRDKGGETFFNVDMVVLAKIIPLEKSVFEELGISYSSSGKTNTAAWNKFISDHKGTSPKQRYHYLPKYLDLEESVVDFKRILSCSIKDIVDPAKVRRIATISSPFARDVQSRFSAYFGRQGQPVGQWSE